MKLAADPSPVLPQCPEFQPADKTASVARTQGLTSCLLLLLFQTKFDPSVFFKVTEQRKKYFLHIHLYFHSPLAKKLALKSSCLFPQPRTCHSRLTGSLQLPALPTALQLTSGGAFARLILTALIEAGIPLTFTLLIHYQLQASSSQAKGSRAQSGRGRGMKCQQLCTGTTTSWGGAVPHLPAARPTLPSLTVMGGEGVGMENEESLCPTPAQHKALKNLVLVTTFSLPRIRPRGVT